MRRFVNWHRGLIGLALLYTLLNAPKPLTVDDGAYYYFARQIAHDPLHPYAFTMHWYTYPQPANEVLAPPVLPYWLAIAYAVVGEQPWLWKLWLLPFALLFVEALYALARRLARGMEWPIVLLVVVSPAFLPSFNLMLDVPAVSLGLTALALFLRACGRRSVRLALLAGLTAGLAMQTKYTALVTPALILLYALLMRRWALGFVAAATAAAVFIGIEGFLGYQHGESHFLVNFKDSQHAQQLEYKLAVTRALLPMLGGLTPGLILLGLAALGARDWLLAMAGALLAATYVSVGVNESEIPLFGIWGFALIVLLVIASVRLFWLSPLGEEGHGMKGAGLTFWLSLFVLLWLLLELVAYVPLAPFPAARRVMGTVLASTFLLGRCAAVCSLPAGRVYAAVAGGALGGLFFYGVDFLDAEVQKNTPIAAAAWIAQQPGGAGGATVWYTGHWGFQYYAERAGMKAVVPFHPRVNYSLFRPGDWLVVPDDRWNQQWIDIDPQCAKPMQVLAIPETLPWRTVQCFYGGHVPLEQHFGPRITVTIYRITEPWTPSPR